MTTEEKIETKLAEIRRKRKKAQDEKAKLKEVIKKLDFAEKALKAFSGSVKSGKAESILRHFAE